MLCKCKIVCDLYTGNSSGVLGGVQIDVWSDEEIEKQKEYSTSQSQGTTERGSYIAKEACNSRSWASSSSSSTAVRLLDAVTD